VNKESAEEVEKELKMNETRLIDKDNPLNSSMPDYAYDEDYQAAISQQGIPEFTDYGPNDWRNLMQGAQAHSKAVATKTVSAIGKNKKRNRGKAGGTGRAHKNKNNMDKGKKGERNGIFFLNKQKKIYCSFSKEC
jgi:hypothetical protein